MLLSCWFTQDENGEDFSEDLPLISDQGTYNERSYLCYTVIMICLDMPSKSFEIIKKFEMVSDYVCSECNCRNVCCE